MKSTLLKRVAGIMAFLMLAIQITLPVHATAGACSGHDGVNCSAGADTDESVICNDGTTDSSVDYIDMEDECGEDFIVTAAETDNPSAIAATTTSAPDPDPAESFFDVMDEVEVDSEKEVLVELSEDVDVDNVVDVISEDVEDISEEVGEDLVDEAVDEIMEEIEEMDEDEAAEAIEDIEEDINDAIDEANEEIKKDPGKRAKLYRKIQHLKSLLAKIRARAIKRHHGLINLIRKIKNHPAVYSVRWGDLSGTNYCAGTKPAEVIQDLAAGEVPCGIEAFEYSGKFSVDSGTLKVRKRVLFEPKFDEVTVAEGSSIAFDSGIAGHWDGLIVEYIPATNDDGTKPEVNITISLGDLSETYTGSEVVGQKSIGNGHMLEIKRIATMLSGVSSVNQDKLIEQKIKVQEKISNIQDKLYRLRLLNKDRSTLDAIEDAVNEAGEYNFDETSSSEVQEEINKIATQLRDNVSKEDAQNLIKNLRRKIAEIKAMAKGRKFAMKMIPFKDTDDNEWYTNYVSAVKNRGIISGYKDAYGNDLGEYRPGNNITVAEILKIALETANKGTSAGTPKLNAAINHWAKGYVKKAEELGLDIVSGNVDLNRPATRAEVVRLVLEALDIDPDTISSTSFSDLAVVHKHAAYVEYAKDLGIISGDAGKTTFRPDAPINRAEAAKIADLILSVIIGGTDTIDGDEPWE